MSDYESIKEDANLAHEADVVEMTAFDYENLMNDLYWAKQDKVDSVENARTAKKMNAKDRAIEVKKFNAKMRSKVSAEELVKLVKAKFGISKATFHRDLK